MSTLNLDVKKQASSAAFRAAAAKANIPIPGNKDRSPNQVQKMSKPGLYANIHAKRKRIKAGSGEKMRKPGSKGAPTTAAFLKSAKTAKEVMPFKSEKQKRYMCMQTILT